jgi:hypothetical protein
MGITLNWKLVFGLTAIFFLSSFASADEAMPAETLNKLKAATVFIKVEAGKERASGSGFVVLGHDRDAQTQNTRGVVSVRRRVPAQVPAGFSGVDRGLRVQ